MSDQPYIAVNGSVVDKQSHRHSHHQQISTRPSPAVQYLTGYQLRKDARSDNVKGCFGSDWYPGQDTYEAIKSNPFRGPLFAVEEISPDLSYNQQPPQQEYLGPLVSEPQVLELAVSGEHTVFGNVYELSAHIASPRPLSPSVQGLCRQTSRSQATEPLLFQQEYGYLKSLVTSGEDPTPPNRRVVDKEDITHLSQHIIRGSSASSFVDRAESLSPKLPTRPLSPSPARHTSRSSPTPVSTVSLTVPLAFQDTTQDPVLILSTAPPPPLPAKPQAYRNNTDNGAFNADTEAHETQTQTQTQMENQNQNQNESDQSPPPLPAKPFPYHPINYEAMIESRYGPLSQEEEERKGEREDLSIPSHEKNELYYRRTWGDGLVQYQGRDGGGANAGDGEEGMEYGSEEKERKRLRVVNPNVPGWTI